MGFHHLFVYFFSQVAQSDRTPTTFAAWFPGFQKILDGQVKYDIFKKMQENQRSHIIDLGNP